MGSGIGGLLELETQHKRLLDRDPSRISPFMIPKLMINASAAEISMMYGLNGANCFGLSYFTNKKENGDYTLEEGQALTFKYRVIIHSGDVNEARIAERFNDYANPPEASWAD